LSQKERLNEMLSYWNRKSSNDNLKLQEALTDINFDFNSLENVKTEATVEPKYETCYASPVVQESVAPPVVVSYEERDIIKDSESIEASDGDDQKNDEVKYSLVEVASIIVSSALQDEKIEEAAVEINKNLSPKFQSN